MFVKVIPLNEVLVGDVICKGEDELLIKVEAIVELPFDNLRYRRLKFVGNIWGTTSIGFMIEMDRAFVGLVHRPWPARKTERDMRNTIRTTLVAVRSAEDDELDEALAELREVLDAYDLGKPKEPMLRLR